MSRPKTARQIGVKQECKVYIEEYVMTFLLGLQKGNQQESVNIYLLGKIETDKEGEFYIVYGAMAKETAKKSGKYPEYVDAKKIFHNLDIIGYLDRQSLEDDESFFTSIKIGGEKEGQPIKGYLLFFDTNDSMKEYLNACYRIGVNPEFEKTQSNTSMDGKITDCVLDYVRAAVICIFIVLCAIAVTTINSHNKIDKFTEAAAEITNTFEETDQ